jgi:hypothetical protein
MPYIPRDKRVKYDIHIENLATILNSQHDNDIISGEMNYILFRLAMLLCDRESGGKCCYARLAVVSSALSEAQTEFRRRIMAPYEDQKIELEGDVE